MSKCPAERECHRGMRALVSGKSLAAVLIVAVLAVSCFVILSGSNESEAADSPDRVYVANTYGGPVEELQIGSPAVEYSDGEKAGYYNGYNKDGKTYSGGVLVLTNFRGTMYDGVHVENGKSACIYANGSITIVLEGENSDYILFPNGTNGCSSNYGIYVNGDLTIVSHTLSDTEISFINVNRHSSTESAGIYCSGRLTVINESNHYFRLYAKGDTQSFDDGSSKTSYATYGIKCGSAVFGSDANNNRLAITAIGGDITTAPKAGTVHSIGIYSNNGGIDIKGNTEITGDGEKYSITGAVGGSINISGYTNNVAVISAGIYSATAFSYNPTNADRFIESIGGDIFMDLNTSTYGKGGISYGIYAGSMSAGGKITATGGKVPLGLPADTSDSYGIWTTSFTGNHATITATASDATRVSCGFFSYGGFDTGEGSTITCSGGAAPSNIYPTYSAGLSCIDYTGRNGSNVTGTSGTACYSDTITAGVKVSTITMNGNAKLTGVGGDTCLTYTPAQYANSSNRVATGSAGSTYGVYIDGNSVRINDTSILTGNGGNIDSGQSDPNAVTAGVYFEYSVQDSTISGTGSIQANGGTVAYSTSDNQWNVSAGIYASRALIINGTDISAEGNTVCTETDAASASRGSRSYGIYAKSLSILGGSEVSAEGGANGCYSPDLTAPKYNDSIGIYVTGGNLSVSGGSSITATGKGSQRIIGIIVNGNISVEGGSTITANVPANESRGYITNFDGIGKASIGIYLSSDTSSFSVPSGTVILTGTTQAVRCTGGNTGTFSGVEALWTSDSLTGEGAEIIASSTNIADVSSVYVKMDNTFSVVFGGGWTYGDDPTVPEFSNEDRVVSVNYLGTDVFGDDYDSSTPPTNAGNYSLQVIYDGDREKIIGFTISPRTGGTVTLAATWHYYDGTEQVALPKEVKWNGEVIDRREYHGTAGDITFTTPGNYSVTLTLDKNYVGTKVYNYTVGKATASESMFNILPLADVGYTGNPVVVPAPTPKVPTLSGYGSITVLYDGSEVAPTNVGTHQVTFDVEGGDYVNGRELYIGTFDITPYTVSFDGNGGGGSMTAVTNAAGDYELPRCRFTAPEHMHFSQWAVGSEEGPRYDAYAHIQVLNDVTLYAIWAYDVHTITFRASGGTGDMDQVSKAYGQNYTLPANGFTAPAHKEFKCWVIDEVEYPAGAEITIEKNIEVWAEWVYVKYTVSATIDHGTVDLPTQKVEYLSDSLEITFTAAAGYVIRSYFINPSSTNIPERPSVWSFTVERVTGDVNLSVSTLPTFTVTWKSYDGETELEVDTNVPHGTAVSFDGSAPTLAPTVQYTYTFAGWATAKEQSTGTAVGSLPYVTGNVTYYAAFSAKANKYWVTFNNYNGVALQSDKVEYGAMPEYRSSTPTRSADAQHVYTFAGWDPEITAVTGPVTYTATYSEDPRPYTITFKNYDGTTLQSEQVGYGSVPAYHGSEPTKAATAQYSFTFNGWTPAIASVTGDATYTATFSQSVRSYTVTFKNGDDVLQSDVLEYGSMPEYRGETPTKAADAQYTYTFREWTPGLSTVRGDATYTATFSQSVRSYTVTFKNGDDVLQSGLVEYGQMPAYTGLTPTKASTAQYTYNFNGWTPAVASVTGDATYTAIFSEDLRSYTIRFVNDGGTELQSSQVLYGQIPGYTGETPTKEATAQYTYTFDHWSPEISPVTGTATYTATYNSTVNKYTVRFVNHDGIELQSGLVEYGETPAYTGSVPIKEATAQYTYTFNTWAPAIVTVTSDATYTATYNSTVNKYTVRFVNHDGTELQSGLVEYGDTPGYSGETPTKAATAQYTYTFNTWEPVIATVTGDVTYTATYSSTVNKYTITFQNEGGAVLQSGLVEYGQTPAYTGVMPTKTATAQYTYTFDGWTPVIVTVTGDATYTATYNSTVNKYTVTFQNEGGAVLQSGLVEYGETPVYAGTTPQKDADNYFTYTFAGWNTSIVPVTGNATYTATFDCARKQYTVSFATTEGGSGSMDSAVVDSGDYTLPANGFTPDAGMVFESWTYGSPSGQAYLVNGVCDIHENVTFYAKWADHHHTLVPIPAVPATCTETGLTEGSRCSDCGRIIVEQTELPALGHHYEDVVTAPTCTEGGYTTHTCSRCGDSYVDSHTEALGHDWSSAEYTWSADGKTCTVTLVCGRDHAHTITVPNVTVISSVKTAATTSSKGVTTYSVSGTYQGYAYSDSMDVTDIPALESMPAHKEGTSTYENEVTENMETAVTETFNTAKNNGGDVEVTVSTSAAGSMTIAFDNAAVNAIAGNEVSLEATVRTSAPEAAGAELVIEISLKGATFADGKAKVSVPFSETVPEGKTVKVYFINGDKKEDMNATLVDGKVVFETNHFSTYAIFFEDAPVADDSGSNGGGFPVWAIILIVVAVLAAAGVGAFFVVKNKKA